MLDNMVSPIDHAIMNHQNQTWTTGIWGHVRYTKSQALTLCRVSVLHLPARVSNTSRWACRTSWWCQLLPLILLCIGCCWRDHKHLLIEFDYLSFYENILYYIILYYIILYYIILYYIILYYIILYYIILYYIILYYIILSKFRY
jgi:hypothetical protein